jgi:hypothetical protein
MPLIAAGDVGRRCADAFGDTLARVNPDVGGSDRLVAGARQASFAVISTVDCMPSGRSAGSGRP